MGTYTCLGPKYGVCIPQPVIAARLWSKQDNKGGKSNEADPGLHARLPWGSTRLYGRGACKIMAEEGMRMRRRSCRGSP